MAESGAPNPVDAWADEAACGLLQTDQRGLITRVNQTFCTWVGQSREQLVGVCTLQSLLTMGGRIFHQTHWVPLLQLQGSVSEVKLELKHPDGGVIPMVLNAIRRERDGAVVHDVAAFIARDRDKYERELVASRKTSQRLADEANRLRLLAEQMVGVVSHDLRSPLSVIKLSAGVLARLPKGPDMDKVIARIDRSSDRATRMVSDLLDFTQAKLGGGIAVTRKTGALHKATAECVDELRAAYPGRIIQHHASGEGDCAFDADRIAQLVGNLVANAITHGLRDGPVTVFSTIGVQSFNISVHNLGAAIPLADREAIFDPMSRGHGASTNEHSIGLGLFIASQIVKAHGGELRVSSDDEKGTMFSADMPRTPLEHPPGF